MASHQVVSTRLPCTPTRIMCDITTGFNISWFVTYFLAAFIIYSFVECLIEAERCWLNAQKLYGSLETISEFHWMFVDPNG